MNLYTFEVKALFSILSPFSNDGLNQYCPDIFAYCSLLVLLLVSYRINDPRVQKTSEFQQSINMYKKRMVYIEFVNKVDSHGENSQFERHNKKILDML